MKTDWLRTALIAGIAIVCFLLVIRWNDFQERQSPPALTEATYEQTAADADPGIPEAVEFADGGSVATDPTVPSARVQAPAPGNLIKVRTDVLDVSISAHGGDLVRVALPTFYAALDTPDQPFVLLNQTPAHTYIARSGLVGPNGTDLNSNERPVFQAAQNEYRLAATEDTLNVDLLYQQTEDVRIIKRFTFTRGSHVIAITYRVDNASTQPWNAQIYGQIKRDAHNPNKSGGFGLQPYLGAATSTVDTNYEKVDFGDMRDQPFVHDREGGWLAMVQHYFLSAWIPPAGDMVSYRLFSDSTGNMFFLQFAGAPISAAPNATAEKTFEFYAGPKHIRKLEQIAPFLDLTVDYSFLWWIAKPLFFALEFIHGLVGNWGFAIILLTVLIKAVFLYPSAMSYRSMGRMRKLQPKMAELKERYGDNKQKFSAEMMKLYKEEKVNPFGSCLPVLIQMPVFLALYWVLMESVELRHAPFILWIEDLSVRDPYFILPLIMGATMWIQQKLNPTPPDPMQAKVMQMMPIFFTFLFLFFPAGLVLYWVVNNSLSITQQYIITRQIEKA